MPSSHPSPQYVKYFSDELIRQTNRQIKVEAVNTAALAAEKKSNGDIVVPDEVKAEIGKFMEPAKPRWLNASAVKAIQKRAQEDHDKEEERLGEEWVIAAMETVTNRMADAANMRESSCKLCIWPAGNLFFDPVANPNFLPPFHIFQRSVEEQKQILYLLQNLIIEVKKLGFIASIGYGRYHGDEKTPLHLKVRCPSDSEAWFNTKKLSAVALLKQWLPCK